MDYSALTEGENGEMFQFLIDNKALNFYGVDKATKEEIFEKFGNDPEVWKESLSKALDEVVKLNEGNQERIKNYVEAVHGGLEGVTRNGMRELMSFANPPQGVKEICSLLVVFLNYQIEGQKKY